MEQFRYKLLDHERGAIRLVRLLSGTNKPIRLESIHSNLDEESCIPYEAVSYMRGSTNEGWTVEVDGQQLTITRNLSLALLSLRHANEDRILWIDSICINKFDIEERRKQEQQMYTIYRRAKKVIVWSSKSTPKTDLVILSMQRLEKEAQKHWYKNRKSSDRLWLKLWSAVGNGGKDFIIQQKGIENSLSQSWSKREWTLQEGANAQSAKVADDLKTVSEPIPQVTKVVIPVNQDLTTVLMRFEVSRASKLSVKMYALLDLQSDKHTRAHVLDNSKSSVEVVQDTVAAALGFDMGWRSFCSLPEWELSDLYKNSLLLKEKVMRWAIEEGQLATLKSIMLGQRINVVGDSFGHGSLPWKPILHQVTAIANSLFEIGADVNLHHEKSCNALVAVVRNGHRQIEKLLLERFTEVERSGDDRITTRKVLPWLVAAPRPLSLDEIDAALSAELDKPGASIRPYGRDVEELLSFCGPLVRLVPHEKAEQQQVSLAHFSVKDYLHTERRELLSGSGDNSDLLDGKGLMMRALLEAKSPLNATDDWIQQQKFEEDDVQSLFPEDGDAAFPTSMLLPSWASARRTMVGIFTNSSVLSPLYSKALQLMTEKRFISNFEYLLKAFHGSLVASDDSNVARQLAKFLESSQRRSRIARMVVARHVALQSPWDEGNLANLRDQEKQAYTNMEDWLDRTVVSPTIINTPANRSGDTDKEFKSGNDSNSELNREENISHFAQYPRLYLVVQKLVEGRPFKDMLTGFKELLLPPGLLKELLPIPRDNITYRTTEETGLLSTVQGFLEEITALEWDWWPLSPRMRPLKPSETRVHWKCFCGANRWRELKLEQQEILIEVLKEPPADHHPRPLCALLQDTKNTSCTKTSGPSRNPRVRSKFCTVFENGLIFMATALGCWYGDIKVGWFWCFFTIACFVWVIVVFQNPTSRPNQKATPGAHRSATSSGAVPSLGAQAMQSQPGNSATSQVGGNLPIQPTSASSPTTQGSLVNNSVYNKQLWVNFGVDGSGIPTELDQLGGLDLVSDSTFLRNLRKRHLEIRGRLRHYLSIRIISYWEFLRFKRLQLHPPQTIDVKADLPTSSDYEYDPRPPNATLDNPGITKHEFEVYVRLCLEPCWLPSLLIPHKCRTVKDSAVDIIDRVPKYKKFLEQHAQGDEHIWGIRARYVVSSVRVIALHVAILCISFGVWIWWQWKHPDDLQGAAVALGTAFLLVSTFWSATGVLKDLR